MKIYTKKGDTGKTALIGGTRVPKHHLRVEAYGTIDELNVAIGMLADQIDLAEIIGELRFVQDRLFTMGALLAADPKKNKMILPTLHEKDVVMLEKAIDAMEATLPELKNFILPGGHIAVSYCHIARVVCRRAERIVSQLAENDKIEPIIIKYLNRLSDYLFVLSRRIGMLVNAAEIPWKPGQ